MGISAEGTSSKPQAYNIPKDRSEGERAEAVMGSPPLACLFLRPETLKPDCIFNLVSHSFAPPIF